ncbi:chlorophyll synthase ChlG [Terricaulis sp.]|uniref:chlorophyll synthase ChlG n=1 Tax=Terricaulis sp. TaxID=2768686 RepID=UPI002AC4BB9C|nr:chlorophyll synthase ChlG [Terricaulis sp.]MDZ4691330.1 chlorophyll synthase ChlG [Terricaulis sp.]
MAPTTAAGTLRSFPAPSAVLELFKPITWFPPMWAFGCGVISSGADLGARWPMAVAGIILAGPLICATSQAVNDWYDRDVDAINEPNRPIPSGRIPGRWGLFIAIGWTIVSMLWAYALGPWVFGAAVVGMGLAWIYSAPPLRLKQSGWLGPAACALSYEGITWFTGAAVMLGSLPNPQILIIAALYSFGAHGIMVLNDFKAIEGDRQTGVRSLPVQLGVDNAAKVACAVMLAPQAVVIALLLAWGQPLHAIAVTVSFGIQIYLMARLITDPRKLAPWFNGTGVLLYVLGMLVSAFALGGLAGVGA